MPEPTPTPSPTPTPTPWIDGIADTDIRGYAQNRGYDKLDLSAAFVEAAKAHRAAEAHIGAPANEILRLPKQGDEAAAKAFWSKLGAGEKAEDYAFENVTFGDDAANARFVAGWRNEALKLNMPKEMADAALRFFHKNIGDVEKANGDIAAAKLAEEKEALAKLWGPRAEAYTFVAKQAAAKLGAEFVDAVAALEGQVGYSKVMDMFRKLGEMTGEARYVAPGGQGGDLPMNADQARARLSELMGDGEWVKRYQNGGSDEKKQFMALTTLIANG